VVFSPLASGILTGKYDAGIPEDSRLARIEWLRNAIYREEAIEAVRKLKAVADDLGVTRAQLAIAWTLRQPGVSSAITGATKARQLEETLKAIDIILDDDVVARIDGIIGTVAG
jgi:aryl-alcohol dehydrogenase-like predicted oxidoreductase